MEIYLLHGWGWSNINITHRQTKECAYRRHARPEADVDAEEGEARLEVADRLVELLLPRDELGHVELQNRYIHRSGFGLVIDQDSVYTICVVWMEQGRRPDGCQSSCQLARGRASTPPLSYLPARRSACPPRRASPRGPAAAPPSRTLAPPARPPPAYINRSGRGGALVSQSVSSSTRRRNHTIIDTSCIYVRVHGTHHRQLLLLRGEREVELRLVARARVHEARGALALEGVVQAGLYSVCLGQ